MIELVIELVVEVEDRGELAVVVEAALGVASKMVVMAEEEEFVGYADKQYIVIQTKSGHVTPGLRASKSASVTCQWVEKDCSESAIDLARLDDESGDQLWCEEA